MKKLLLITLFLLVSCSQNYVLYQVPTDMKSKFSENLIGITKLSDDDINEDFSNYQDLNFLEPIAKKNKVILLGEAHYYQKIKHMVNRILFKLRKCDEFSFISIESAYSKSPFLNYYVHIKDDDEATNFYENEIYGMVFTVEFKNFLEHIRRWNKLFPAKQISVGGHDIEHDYEFTITHILEPYFKQLDNSINIIESNKSNLLDIIKFFHSYLNAAKERNLIGKYSFITPKYIENVLTNLNSTYEAYNNNFHKERQKGIIRNLTDENYLGNYLKGKIVLYGGGAHMQTKCDLGGGNEYYEGTYLNKIFKPTKGKCYSIIIECVAYNFAKVADLDTDQILHSGKSYKGYLNSFHQIYHKDPEAINKYFSTDPFHDFYKLLFSSTYKLNTNAFKIDKIDFVSLIKEIDDKSIPNSGYIKLKFRYFRNYDTWIYHLKSDFVEGIKKI